MQSRPLPLHLVFDSQRVNAWKKAFAKMDEDRNRDLWGEFEERVLEQIRSFQVPMIRLSASTSMDAVCAVFERVDTGGAPLNVFELLTATCAGDRGWVAQTGDYYRLPEVRQTVKQGLATRADAHWAALGWTAMDRAQFVEHPERVKDIRNRVARFDADPLPDALLGELATFIKLLRGFVA